MYLIKVNTIVYLNGPLRYPERSLKVTNATNERGWMDVVGVRTCWCKLVETVLDKHSNSP